MAETPKLVSSLGRADLERIFVRGYDQIQICSARLASLKWSI
jgi:hypothetical protein